MSDRATRAAMVEAAFRIANERMAAWEERHADGAPELYLCECATLHCRGRIRLGRDAYEHVRERPQQFLVVPGHEIADLERVLERHEDHLVIEKPDQVLELVTAADPRSSAPGAVREEAESIADRIQDEDRQGR